MIRIALLVFLACLFLAGCSQDDVAVQPSVKLITNPGGQGARYPFLTAGAENSALQMSWLEQNGDHVDLVWASWDGNRWTSPELIRTSDQFFVNWADFPSIASFADAPVAAHWLQKVEGSTYAYHVNLSFRSESGLWSDPITPHMDQSQGEHGFVSMLPLDHEKVFAIWLDGHQTGHGKPMTLHSAVLNREGRMGEEFELDSSICDCCQTGLARSGDSLIAVYRNRTSDEIRDIYRAVFDLNSGQWSEPEALSDEGWEIDGCPVNGPQVAAFGEQVIASWYSAANGQPGSFVAVSGDGGHSFSGAKQVDLGHSAGRLGVAVNQDGIALILWIESVGEQATVQGRFWRNHSLEDSFVIGKIDPSRASGFPRVAASGADFMVAWTSPGSEYSSGSDSQPGITTALVSVSPH